MTNKTISFSILAGAVMISAFITMNALAQGSEAQDATAITYPVTELGNCKDQASCKTYCDSPTHLSACLSFAEKNNLMSGEELAQAKKFLAAGAKGPGGCTNKDSCEQYCNVTEHIDECVTFAETSGMMSPEELADAKKVMTAIKSGVKPPACNGKKACDTYCEDPNHIEECITFAKAAGFMSAEEQANADKMIQAIKNGVKPLPCKGKEACDAYCSQEENIDQCVAFSEAAGFMTKDEAAMAKKTKGKGPGGCKSKTECDTFCNNPDNQQTCLNFGIENGLIPPDELQKIQEGNKQFRDSIQNAPPEVSTCLSEALGADTIVKLKDGSIIPTREMGDKMGQCFRQMQPEQVQGQNENGPGPGVNPPQNFAPGTGMPGPNVVCQGDNCQNMPPPVGPERQGSYPGTSPSGEQQPMMPQQPYVSPTSGTNPGMPTNNYYDTTGTGNTPMQPIQPAGGGTTPPPGGWQTSPPPAGTAPGETSSQPIQQNAPAPMLQPAPQQPPTTPAPAPAPTPSPTSMVSPESMLGAVISVFNSFQPQ